MMDRLLNWIARLAFVFLYVPIVGLIVYSFNASEVSYRFDGFSLRWYAELFQDTLLLNTLQTSAIVGVVSAVLATAIGFATALAVNRYRIRGRGFFLGAILVPLIVPEIVLGVSLLSIFQGIGVPMGYLTLVLGHLVVTLPLATLIMIGALSALDPSLPEAANDLGASGWTSFRLVTLPLVLPSVLASFLLAFTTSFSNIVISTFTAGVGTTTLPLRIYSSVRTGLSPELNALGTLMVVATVVLILIIGVGQLRRILAGTPAK